MKVHKFSYKIEFKQSAYKEFKSLPENIRDRISEAIKILCINPYSELLVYKKIKGKDNYYRIKIGVYRVIYSIYNDILVVKVIRVGHRKDIYKFI